MILNKDNKQLGLIHSDNGFYVGDPCYVLSDDIYDDIWGEQYGFKDGVIKTPKGDFIVHSTKYGDGGYPSNIGFTFPVDSGTLAVIPLELVTKEFDRLGTSVKSKKAQAFWNDEDGVFSVDFDLNRDVIEIVTSYNEDYEFEDSDIMEESCDKKSLKEDFMNPGKYFELLQDMEDIDANLWNNTRDQSERDNMVRPFLQEFWDKYKEEMTTADIEALFDDMEDCNYHTEYRVLRDIIENDAYKMNENANSTYIDLDEIIYMANGFLGNKFGHYNNYIYKNPNGQFMLNLENDDVKEYLALHNEYEAGKGNSPFKESATIDRSKFKSNNASKCPVCNKPLGLIYGYNQTSKSMNANGDFEFDDDGWFMIPWKCEKCGTEGDVVFSTEYYSQGVQTKEGFIVLTDDCGIKPVW